MRLFSLVLLTLFFSYTAIAQQADSLRKANTEWFSIHMQATVINQFKPAFKVSYSGDNSLSPQKESQTSITSTLFLGARLWKGASIYFNPEIAGGSGLSQALGIGDATNGETFRVGSSSPKVYIARVFMRQIFALRSAKIYQETDQNQLAGYIPEKYLALTVGKVGIADYFDDNSYSHDARTQFMCWGLMDNGAWDYPANTRGYTPSAILEYITPKHELRYSVSLLPKVANGPTMDWNLGRSSAHNLEYTHRHNIGDHKGAVRLLAFYNTTNMGNYRQSIAFSPINPDLSSSQKYGNYKYGFTINAEQEINSHFGAFGRASWNDGNTEIWAFTQIDNSVSGGFLLDGSYWKRPNDHIGLAYVTSGLSKPHQDYLNAGGKDFMLGDGKLNYSREHLIETYYSFELKKDQLYLTCAYQFLMNPGYNKDRQGPVNVFSIRVHMNI